MIKLSLASLLLICSLGVWAAEPPPAMDNSEQNTIDAEGTTLVPTDQSKGSDEDVEHTRKLREALVQQSDLSTYAQNIKIITIKGKTVLRGPVGSNAEKAKVATIARNVLGKKAKIQNNLTISK